MKAAFFALAGLAALCAAWATSVDAQPRPGAGSGSGSGSGTETGAGAGPPLSNSMVIIDDNNGDGGYRPVKTKELEAFRQQMVNRKPLEEYVEFMAPVRLLKPIRVVMEECGQGPLSSPLYQPVIRSLVMCYEFMKTMEEVATRVVQAQNAGKQPLPFPITHDRFVAGLFAGIILHESGHALFDNFDVPLFGRQEDAADQMAAFIATQFNRQVAEMIASAYADVWAILGPTPTQAPNTQDTNYPKDVNQRCMLDPFCHFSDVHGSNEQRFFNTICLVYGSDPVRYASYVKNGLLPPDRDCVGEYRQVRHAFQLTIYPFIDRDLMQQVLTRNWFTPNEMTK